MNPADCKHKFTLKQVDGHFWCVICDIAKDEENVIRQEARYSGPNKCGICVCGCSWEDHHLGIIARPGFLLRKEGVYEHYVPQECDNYGCNETGGMKFNDSTQEWEPHCYSYMDAGNVDFCADCGEKIEQGKGINWMGTSTRCLKCHIKRMTEE